MSIFEDRTSKLNRYEGAFEWAFEIPEVLDENGKYIGFDVIIGNPPYIQLQKMKDESEKLEFQGYSTCTKTGDIYCLFYERGNQLLKKNGILSFITSNKWMRAAYGEKLRRYLADFTNPTILIDFAGSQIFDNVTVETNILTFEKSPNKHNTLSCAVKEKSLNNLSVYVEQNSSYRNYDTNKSWVILSSIESSIKEKIEKKGTPLKEWNVTIYRGILTGYNKAFIIDSAKKDELIAADPKSAEIIRPFNMVYFLRY